MPKPKPKRKPKPKPKPKPSQRRAHEGPGAAGGGAATFEIGKPSREDPRARHQIQTQRSPAKPSTDTDQATS